MAGFSYRGINITSFDAHWVPAREDWYIWEADFKTIDKVEDAQDGGNWYENSIDPKQFELFCYFENITEAAMQNLFALFDKDTKGDLIFDERPWLVYSAIPTKPVKAIVYPAEDGKYNGTFTVYLTAYYPFAKGTINTMDQAIASLPEFIDKIRATTGLLPDDRMPSPPIVPIINASKIRVYNAGNTRADTVLKIAGDVGDGVMLYNQQTGQYCKIIGITQDMTGAINRWLEIDSKTGECYITDSANKWPGYRYHDKGFIQLAPSAPILRDIGASYTGSSILLDADVLTDDAAGKSIWINGWQDITTVLGPRNAILSEEQAEPGSSQVDIVTINNIIITPVSGISLTKLEIAYNHTFS